MRCKHLLVLPKYELGIWHSRNNLHYLSHILVVILICKTQGLAPCYIPSLPSRLFLCTIFIPGSCTTDCTTTIAWLTHSHNISCSKHASSSTYHSCVYATGLFSLLSPPLYLNFFNSLSTCHRCLQTLHLFFGSPWPISSSACWFFLRLVIFGLLHAHFLSLSSLLLLFDCCICSTRLLVPSVLNP